MSLKWWQIPEWLSEDTKLKLLQGQTCDCEKFCNYYQGGRGRRPDPRDLCPLYLRNRPNIFEFSSTPGKLQFLFVPKTSQRLRSAVFRYDNSRLFYQFCWESPSRDGTLFKEEIQMPKEGEGALWYRRKPDLNDGVDFQNPSPLTLTKLKESLAFVLSIID